MTLYRIICSRSRPCNGCDAISHGISCGKVRLREVRRSWAHVEKFVVSTGRRGIGSSLVVVACKSSSILFPVARRLAHITKLNALLHMPCSTLGVVERRLSRSRPAIQGLDRPLISPLLARGRLSSCCQPMAPRALFFCADRLVGTAVPWRRRSLPRACRFPVSGIKCQGMCISRVGHRICSD